MDISDRIKPDHSGIATFLEALKRGDYQIPTFQRDVVWERDNVKKLWDSICRFYPVGSLLIWRTPIRLQKHRAVGGHAITDDGERAEHQYILDGQQRTTSMLTSIYGGTIEGRDGFDPRLFVDLTVEPREEPEDESFKQRFLFWSEIDDGGEVPHRNNERRRRYDDGLVVPLEDVLTRYLDLEEGLDERGFKYRDVPREQLRAIKRVLDSYRIALIELQGIQVAEVCQIFERINQAGKPLNIFDIVVAKTFEPAGDGASGTGFYLRDLIDGFRGELSERGSAFAELDDLTFLQAAAVNVRNEVVGTRVMNVTDRYLNELTADELRAVWPGTVQALRKTFDLFENHLRLTGPALIPNRYLYLVYAAYFYGNAAPDYALAKRFFWYLSFHSHRLLRGTGMMWSQVDFLRGRKGGEDVPMEPFVLNREALRRASYSSRGRYSRAVLALYASHEPRDWEHADRRVLSEVYYQLTDQPNLHHVFPLGFTETMAGAEWVDRNSLMNIAYLTQITNLKISKANPVEYLLRLPAFSGDEGTRRRVAASHLLPDVVFEWARAGALPPDALRQFVEARVELVVGDLTAKVGPELTRIIDSVDAQD